MSSRNNIALRSGSEIVGKFVPYRAILDLWGDRGSRSRCERGPFAVRSVRFVRL